MVINKPWYIQGRCRELITSFCINWFSTKGNFAPWGDPRQCLETVLNLTPDCGGAATGIWCKETRDVGPHPTVHRKDPQKGMIWS